MNRGHVHQRRLAAGPAVIAGELAERAFLGGRARPDDALDHQIGVRGYQQVGGLAAHHRHGLALQAADILVFGDVLREALRSDQHEQRIDPPRGGDLDLLAARPGPLDMQPRVLARRQIEPDLALALLHHPVGADVEIAAIGIARDHRVPGAAVAAAVERPVFGDRQEVEIDLLAEQGVLVDRRVFRRHFRGLGAVLHLRLDSADQLDRRGVHRLFPRSAPPSAGWPHQVPQQPRADRVVLEADGILEQHRRRGLLLGQKVDHGTHHLVAGSPARSPAPARRSPRPRPANRADPGSARCAIAARRPADPSPRP